MTDAASTAQVRVADLDIGQPLHDFIVNEALPGTGVDPEVFWNALSTLVHDYGARNRELLEVRAEPLGWDTLTRVLEITVPLTGRGHFETPVLEAEGARYQQSISQAHMPSSPEEHQAWEKKQSYNLPISTAQ